MTAKTAQGAKLVIPVHSAEHFDAIELAELALSYAGIHFEKGWDLGRRLWFLDWSLKGARLEVYQDGDRPEAVSLREDLDRG